MLQVPENEDSDDEATMAAPQRRMPFGGMIHHAARNVLLNKMTVKKQDAQPSVAQSDEPIQYAKAVANEKSNLDELDDLLGSLGSDSSSGCDTHSEDLDL